MEGFMRQKLRFLIFFGHKWYIFFDFFKVYFFANLHKQIYSFMVLINFLTFFPNLVVPHKSISFFRLT